MGVVPFLADLLTKLQKNAVPGDLSTVKAWTHNPENHVSLTVSSRSSTQ